MTVRVRANISVLGIIKSRRLDGEAQRFFTHEVRRLCDPYVPFAKGNLKNTAVEQDTKIVYPQVYAKKQYYENGGEGTRGKRWDRRMIAQRGNELKQSVVAFINGRLT